MDRSKYSLIDLEYFDRWSVFQSPLAISSSAGTLERLTHVGGDGFNTVVGGSRRPGIILYIKIRSPRILLWTKEKSHRSLVSYGTWRSPFTNFTAHFLNAF